MSISTCALHEEGDLAAGDILLRVSVISIHALREEGDLDYMGIPTKYVGISIHALREEGDRSLVERMMLRV